MMKTTLRILLALVIVLCAGYIFLHLFSTAHLGSALLGIILPALAAFVCAWVVGRLTTPGGPNAAPRR